MTSNSDSRSSATPHYAHGWCTRPLTSTSEKEAQSTAAFWIVPKLSIQFCTASYSRSFWMLECHQSLFGFCFAFIEINQRMSNGKEWLQMTSPSRTVSAKARLSPPYSLVFIWMIFFISSRTLEADASWLTTMQVALATQMIFCFSAHQEAVSRKCWTLPRST